MFFEGYSCSACGKRLEKNDDAVACPVCGAAHHRQCWIQEGKCAYAEKHGTPEQFDAHRQVQELKQKERKNQDGEPLYSPLCPYCRNVNPSNASRCERCGMELIKQAKDGYNNNYGRVLTTYPMLFDPLGGVSPDTKIDGIPVTDIATFVGSNSQYYIPRFVAIKQGYSGGFNFIAALIKGVWMAYRRMIKYTLMYELVSLAFLIFNIIVLSKNDNSILSVLLPAVPYILLFFIGFYANRMYLNHVISKIKDIRQKYSDENAYRQQLRLQGGVRPNNLFVMAMISLAVIILLSFIATLFFPNFITDFINNSI